ncbi:TetR family transcriptional regulator [Ilumatobacter fluminis]|uniref:TetR family transcriptional regulator n=1 Tax=Ilumatobacter fluminis TaxID=467091 RepID=A0A4R7I3H8_9ACTN|nr:TetR/AcrR family transcriptional regulator [Ilumatobacter fluminis]TDT18192.1 TetR family transcriptional regulator [Ilumatobacter fluminis]
MPRRVDHDQRRAELLEAAVDAIAEYGLDHVKLTDIAASAGVTTGALGYYFRDKSDLLVATLDYVAAKMSAGDSRLAMTFFGGGVGLYLPTTDEVRRVWRVWLAYCGAAPSSPKLMDAYRRFYRTIEDRIARYLADLGHPEPQDAAGAIVAAVDGIGLCATVAPDLWPDDRQVRTMRAFLEPILAPIDQGVSA